MSSIAKIVFVGALTVLTLGACTAASDSLAPDAAPSADAAVATPCVPIAGAPTYTQLYNSYFARNTEGHCAKEACHGEPNFNIWMCGATKDSCYNGMVAAGIISKTDPKASKIADATSSPLRWFRSNAAMPADRVREFPEGRDAIKAWVASCALNN